MGAIDCRKSHQIECTCDNDTRGDDRQQSNSQMCSPSARARISRARGGERSVIREARQTQAQIDVPSCCKESLGVETESSPKRLGEKKLIRTRNDACNGKCARCLTSSS